MDRQEIINAFKDNKISKQTVLLMLNDWYGGEYLRQAVEDLEGYKSQSFYEFIDCCVGFEKKLSNLKNENSYHKEKAESIWKLYKGFIGSVKEKDGELYKEIMESAKLDEWGK